MRAEEIAKAIIKEMSESDYPEGFDLKRAIVFALLAARRDAFEEAAKIAETFLDFDGTGHSEDGQAIAAAIREAKKQSAQEGE